MIGPTGVGKTEIARRLARLAGAPFIKVEATKFTEVGYVGRDVDSIIKRPRRHRRQDDARAGDGEGPPPRRGRRRGAHPRRAAAAARSTDPSDRVTTSRRPRHAINDTRQRFRKMLREGQLDDREIEIELRAVPTGVEIMAPPGMEELTQQLQGMFSNLGGGPHAQRRVKSRSEQAAGRGRGRQAHQRGRTQDAARCATLEQNGIVFLDEIDKIARRSGQVMGADVSREGVQRDLLPLVEGSTVSTKHGMVKTDHVLFIASGAFHMSKPSDLIPELQGRLPIRVELAPLGVEDFVRILTEPDASLCAQYKALLATENVRARFTPSGVRRVAESRLRRERAHREHRRAAPAHRHGAAARDRELRPRVGLGPARR
jgi:ATP-dependent HslUV protease ATP-binding subunit HslU